MSTSTIPAPARQGGTSFLDFPPEIRESIYRLVLISDAEWIRPIDSWTAETLKRYPTRVEIDPWPRPVTFKTVVNDEYCEHKFTTTVLPTGILRANQQICMEARRVIVRDNRIALTLEEYDTEDEDALYQSARQLEILRDARILALRVAEPFSFDETCRNVLTARTNIQTLRVQFLIGWESYRKFWHTGAATVYWHLRWLCDIKVCAAVTLDHDMTALYDATPEWQQPGERPEARVEKLNLVFDRLAREMLRICACEKDKEGDHADNVRIGQMFTSTTYHSNDSKFETESLAIVSTESGGLIF